jgi:WD40 repeat protein
VIYDAFMSYSHAADGRLAPALQSALHRFAKPWYRLRALHIFRDKTSLAVTPALCGDIQAALDESPRFILLASPEAAASEWVQREIEHWLKSNSVERMLIVLTGGAMDWDHASNAFRPSVTNALPEMLIRRFTQEPLYLDLRWAREQAHLSLNHPDFRDAVAELAAPLHGRPKDEIIGEDVQQHRRTLRLAWSAVATLAGLTIVSMIAALLAVQQRRIAEQQRATAVEQSRVALARQLAAQSTTIRMQSPDRLPLAVLLSSEAARLHPSFEENQALRAALTLSPRPVQSYPYDDRFGQGRIRALSFSRNGKYLAVARDAGIADLFDVGRAEVLRRLTSDKDGAAVLDLVGKPGQEDSSDAGTEMTSLAFTPDGQILATASNDGTARLWEARSGRQLLTVRHGSHVVSVAFSPDGKLLATGSADGKLRLFKVAHDAGYGDTIRTDDSGGRNDANRARTALQLQMELDHGEEVRQVLFSPNGHLLAAISTNGGISLTSVDAKAPGRVWYAGDAGLALAFSRDGSRLATANGSYALVWDVATHRELFKTSHTNSSDQAGDPMFWIDCVDLSADGKLLATGARDGTARVWNLATGQEVIRLKHAAPVEAVAFSADGTTLGTGSFDGAARLWALPSGRERLRATQPGGSEVVTFSPDGAQIASGGADGSVNIWTLSRGDQVATITHPAPVNAVNMSANGIASVDDRGNLRIWRPDGQIELTRDGWGRGDLIFSEDGRSLAGTTGSSLVVLEASGQHGFKVLVSRGNYTLTPAYLADEDRESQHIRLWEAGDARELTPVATRGLQEIRFDPTGHFLALVEGDPADHSGSRVAIRVRDIAASQDIGTVRLDPHAGHQFALSPGGRQLALFVADSNENADKPDEFIQILDVRTGATLARLRQRGPLDSMRFDPQGTRLLLIPDSGANARQQIDVWDWAGGRLLARLVHEAGISKVRFSAGSPTLATVSAGRVYIWDYSTGALLSELDDAGYVRDVQFSRHGRYVLTGSTDGTAAMWQWRNEDLRTEACKRLTRNLTRAEWQQYLGDLPYQATCAFPTPAGK